ncbi:UDP-N-acetylmuramate dehydrogenase [Priestia filamentosa]|uniref:UDP-N-acetylenolpyruvoylglucosamine reductase n=1 Tax=Priestia filamentosa TaxID=1402861 RepID=A0A1X7D480_9BACI|nr:UDP-N-acetylmuramate dehydrogenase [Priestia filamentosa]AKO93921.1 UDP-N-acetylenolpyruvoylglucosamine reductase [Priestia filamentosa]MDT3764164.1 UDP-N-acetylmuramate dehydrogenase [Priestia filamentosa]OXS71365.1 UDP-N-acetylenolpyruvoylglucosamine reductase [Priestia filamentosa]RJS67008.1 UDP-N-acetylenolpyruvoylglucosamine reductase [Priestia filamentosa]WCM14794.1 UDP-N-acetylmuramate dehydrogenase [Priestia filamentosa]
MERLAQELKENNVGKVLQHEPLAHHTTLKIGGPAELFIEPNSVQGLEKAMTLIKKHNIPWRAIGRGSNLLVSDEGIKGAVIKLGRDISDLTVEETKVKVGGGYSIVALATQLSRKGLTGLEFAAGIPGSVGGAVYMNAGAHGSDMSKILEKALVLFEDGTIEWLTNDELQFSYRHSILQNERPGICIEAVLSLEEGNREAIVEKIQKNKDYRKETQPWNFPCAGSIFRNPLPNYAGELIEKNGLKGYEIGGAKVSDLHANFIVNTGSATAQDVVDLITYIQKTIKEKEGIEMHTEVEIVS